MNEAAKYENLMIEIRSIKDSLAKIVELLTPIQHAWSQPHYYFYEPNLDATVKITGTDNSLPVCNCADNVGKWTGGWWCPVHGQCF